VMLTVSLVFVLVVAWLNRPQPPRTWP
jgi:hypothetical protein